MEFTKITTRLGNLTMPLSRRLERINLFTSRDSPVRRLGSTINVSLLHLSKKKRWST
jgi:hypothetical protein